MKYFKGIETLEQLKKEYRKLAKKFHPDLNEQDTTETMKAINLEYERLFDLLKNKSNHTYEQSESVDTFRDIINELIKYNDLTIDIIGSWLWISGNTFQAKETLKKLNFRWSKKRKKWYYHNDIETSKRVRGKNLTYNQIANKYGITRYKTNETTLIHG